MIDNFRNPMQNLTRNSPKLPENKLGEQNFVQMNLTMVYGGLYSKGLTFNVEMRGKGSTRGLL